MACCGFDKSKRLLEAAEFQAIFDNAQLKVSSRYFLFLSRPTKLANARLGLVISKKNIRTAVGRNRVKRAIRETFRRQAEYPSLDTVVLARRGADQLDSSELLSTLNSLWHQLSNRARNNSH